MTAAASPLTRMHWHHPEWPATALAAGCWLVLLSAVADEPTVLLRGGHPGVGWAVAGHVAAMTVAMMAPLVAPQAHHLAVSSLWSRRYRAVLAYLGGYLGAWCVVGTAMVLGTHALQGALGPPAVLAVAAGVAVLVARSTDHRVRLGRCGATRPLALTGWRADRDCVREGVRMAGRCVATSWAVMLVVMAQGGLLVMAAGTVFVVAERRGLVPDRRLVRWTLAVGVLAVVVTAGSAGGDVVPGVGVIDPHAGH